MDIIPLPVTALHDAPHQPRTDSGDLEALAESMRELGLLQPVVVRPLADEHFEIVAGHRRVAAARTLCWPAIDCRVIALDDTAALAATIAENLQREGITALEESAAVARLQATGAPIARIAAALGKPERWVRQRAQLSQLSDSWLVALSIPTSVVHACPPDLLAIVARLPGAVQERVREGITEDDAREWPTPGAFARWIDREFLRELTEAPFNVDASDLPGGACQLCPKRSACQSQLWDDIGGATGELGRCLDAVCWDGKVAAHVRSVAEAKRAKHPDLLIALDRTRGEAPAADLASDAIPLSQVEQVTKKTEGARPLLIANGPRAGQVVYARPASWAQKEIKTAFAPAPAQTNPDPEQAKAARLARVQTKRQRYILGRVGEHLAKLMSEKVPERVANSDLLTWAVEWGVAFDGADGASLEAVRFAAWQSILGHWCKTLRVDAANTPAQAVDEAKTIMAALGDGLAFEMFCDEAAREVPMPKGLEA